MKSDIKRRDFLCGCSGLAASLTLPGAAYAQGVPWGVTPGTPREPEPLEQPVHRSPIGGDNGRSFIGCHLTATGIEGMTDNRLRQSSGIQQIDMIFTREINAWMLPIFGLAPYCCFYDDSDGANAFATTELLAGRGQGTVAFGIKLMNELTTQFSGEWGSQGLHAAGAIFAHEFGHIAQFTTGDYTPGPTMELQADFMAGWYTGLRALQQGGMGVNFREIAAKMFAIGDFNFKSPSHHGTPQQRLQAYSAGLQFITQNRNANMRQALAAGRRMVG